MPARGNPYSSAVVKPGAEAAVLVNICVMNCVQTVPLSFPMEEDPAKLKTLLCKYWLTTGEQSGRKAGTGRASPKICGVEPRGGRGASPVQTGSLGPSLGTQREKVSWPWQMMCLVPTGTTVNIRSRLKWKISIQLKEQAQQNSWRNGSAIQEDTLQIS